MQECQACLHFEVCSRLGGISDKSCKDFLLNKGSNYVRLPGHIGQTLYYIDRHTGEIELESIVYFNITKTGIKPILKRHNVKFWDYYTWGVSVFTDYTEALTAQQNIKQTKIYAGAQP